MMAEATSEQQLKALANLLLLQQRLREASTEAELGFLLTNDTQNLLPYRSAVLWLASSRRRQGGSIVSVSGAVEHDAASPYVQWMNALCRELASQQEAGVREIRKGNAPESFADGWDKHGADCLTWCPLYSGAGVFLGALALWRDKPLLEAEQRFITP